MKIMDSPDDYHGYWTIYAVEPDEGMQLLRDLFSIGGPNCDNFVLFSTSGVHGSYSTIEEEQGAAEATVTFIVIAPRIVRVHYGNCCPRTPDDFEFLKTLRSRSHESVARIGIDEEGK